MPIYMKYEGATGTGTGKYTGWIELQSCQMGVNRGVNSSTGKASDRESSVPAVSEIVATKFQDSASGALFKESLSGKGKKIIIDFVKDDGTPYLSIELENVLISSFSISGSGGSDRSKAMEALSLNFTKISFSYKATTASSDPKHAMNAAQWRLAIDQSSVA